MSDQYDGIFDHLRPEDFAITTTASLSKDGAFTPEQFSEFVEEQLHAVRWGFVVSDGQIIPVGVLASPTVQRVFVPDDDETLGDFLQRIKREADLIGAQWFFFAMESQSKTFKASDLDVDPENPPAPDSAEMQAALRAAGGEGVVEVIMWYAEAVGAHPETRGGLIPINGSKLQPEYSQEIDPVENLKFILER